MHDLNALVDPADPLKALVKLNRGLAINDRGQILARDEARGCAYLVSPVDENPFVVSPMALPDLDSDGVKEVAVVRAGPIQAEIRSGRDGHQLESVRFLDATMTPVAAALLPDTDADGAPEIAVLATRMSDGRPVAEIRGITAPHTARQLWLAGSLLQAQVPGHVVDLQRLE